MQQKLITFAVPCYNSAAYMRHCIETLLSAGEQAEIILVDDGSVKDETPAICDEYAAKYPTIVKAVHQEKVATARASTRASATPPASTTRSWTATTGWTPTPSRRCWPACTPS